MDLASHCALWIIHCIGGCNTVYKLSHPWETALDCTCTVNELPLSLALFTNRKSKNRSKSLALIPSVVADLCYGFGGGRGVRGWKEGEGDKSPIPGVRQAPAPALWGRVGGNEGWTGSRSFWSSGHSDHALARGFWRFASPRLRLGIVASLLSVSIGSQHIVWLVYTVQWEQWISSTIGSIRRKWASTVHILLDHPAHYSPRHRYRVPG